MNIKKICCLCLFVGFSIVSLSAQNAKNEKSKISAELTAQAVDLLRETNRDVSKLKLPDNRRFFSIEIAGLLWEHDERAARAVLEPLMNEVRQTLSQLAEAVSKIKPEPSTYPGNANVTVVVNSNVAANSRYPSNSTYAGNTNISYGAVDIYYKLSPELRNQVEKAWILRRQLLVGLAQANPKMAYEFLNETTQAVENSRIRGRIGEVDLPLELHIAKLLVKKDINLAADAARRAALKGYESDVVLLVDSIYQENPDQGSQLAEELLQKLRSPGQPVASLYGKLAFARQLLTTSEESIAEVKAGTKKKSLLTEDSVRNLAEYIGQHVLSFVSEDYERDSALTYAAEIEKYAPEKASQIRQKFKKTEEKKDPGEIEREKKYREEEEKQREKQKLVIAEREALSEKLKRKNLSAEERAFILGQIKKYAAEHKERFAKVLELAHWAMESDKFGNFEITESLLKEAETAVGSQTKNYRDHISNWWLAGGYSAIKPEKSFNLLGNTITTLNDVITGFARVAEFIDEKDEIIQDGEFQMSAGPRGGLGREFFSSLQRREQIIFNLANADFARTRALADKFERLEFRLTARLLILKSLLKPDGDNESGRSTADVF